MVVMILVKMMVMMVLMIVVMAMIGVVISAVVMVVVEMVATMDVQSYAINFFGWRICTQISQRYTPIFEHFLTKITFSCSVLSLIKNLLLDVELSQNGLRTLCRARCDKQQKSPVIYLG